MTKPSRDIKEVEKIKEQILESALSIIIKEGFESCTMRKIAAQNSMSATNLYNYFSNKDEIYLALVIKGFEILYNMFRKIDEEQTEPVKKGEALVRGYLAFGLENSYYYDIMFTRATPKYNDYVGTPLEKLATIEMNISMKVMKIAYETVAAVTAGLKRQAEDAEKVYFMEIWSMLHGMITLYNSKIVNYVNEDPSKLYERVIDDVMFLVTRSLSRSQS
ncbi:MAG: TetR/AcrR family transcriptional regulator [bacterium]|nr:TetR/AcrR family transcriptional regulator [bacterium]